MRESWSETRNQEDPMKRVAGWTAAGLIALAAGGTPQAQDQGGNTRPSPQRPSDSPARTAPAPDAGTFIEEMTIAGMTEVELGKMASERASNADVKAFGQMMVKDHSAAGKELAQVASQMQVKQPSQLDEKHKALSAKLSKLQGAEFDREYMAAMVKGHEEVAAKVRAFTGGSRTTSTSPAGSDRAAAGAAGAAGTQASGSRPAGSDAVGTTGSGRGEQALNQWAMKTLPRVEQHLERARDVHGKVK
jgi:predicted outer membrane protein